MMRKIYHFAFAGLLGLGIVSCQKQQTEQERQAEVERRVQDQLASERQKQQADDLTHREADVNAREQALRDKNATVATVTQEEKETTSERPAPRAHGQSQPTASYSIFYNKLEPYGDWIETNDYGYVYRPRTAREENWRPYTNGRWVYTDAGWTWVSAEPFGWATYHYGRWSRLRNVGWVWVPGNEWAPAWVSWRKGGDYVGWAPLPPEARFERRTGIHNWSDSYYDIGPAQYSFVSVRQFGDEQIERAVVPERQNITIVQSTTNVTNITYNNTTVVNNGPSYDELRAQSARPIERLRLERETTVQTDNPRAVVRGDVVSVPAPFIAPQQQERPRTVKETLAQTTVDAGWAGMDQSAVDQARAKNRAEATPPPNAPPKKFERVIETNTATGAAANQPLATPARAIATTPAAMPSATPTLAATVAPLTNPTVSPAPALERTPLGRAYRSATPAPTASVATMAPQQAAPAPAATTTPFLSKRELKKEQKRAMRQGTEENAAPPAGPAPEANAAAVSATPLPTRQEERRAERRALREQAPAVSSAPPTAPAEANSAAAPAAATPFMTKREMKQERRAEKRAQRQAGEPEDSVTPTPTPTASPGA